MDKIKKVFSPGSSKDDEIMYGDLDATKRKEENLDAGSEQDQTFTNQSSSPGSNKYDEQKSGETATTIGTEEDHGKRGIGERLYPERDVVEDHKGSSSGTTHFARPDGNGVAAGTTSTLADRSTTSAGNQSGFEGDVYKNNQASGVTSGDREAGITRLDPGTSAFTDTSNNAGLTTGGLAGSSTSPMYNEPQDHVLDRSHPLRDGSGAATAHINPVGAPEASMSEYISQSESIAHPPPGTATAGDTPRSTGSHINPIGAPSTTNTSSNATGAALLGAGAVATGGPAASSNAQDSTTSGTKAYDGPSSTQSQNQSEMIGFGTSTGGAPKIAATSQQGGNVGIATPGTSDTRIASGETHHPPGRKLDCDGNPEKGYVHHVDGPHSTDAANQLDPGLPATSSTGRDQAVVGGGAVALGSTAQKANTSRGSEYPQNTISSRDTAVGGAAVPAQSHSSTGYDAQESHAKDKSASHTSDDHEEKEKPGLLQKILHPRSHKDDKDASHEHSQPKKYYDEKTDSYREHNESNTAVQDGHNVLHKDPPATKPSSGYHETQAVDQAATGPGREISHGHTKPKKYYDEKTDSYREYSSPNTSVNDGHNVLNKEPPASHPAAGYREMQTDGQAAAGPDWEAVKRANA